MDKHFDVLIVGAGPIGLACGMEAKKAGHSHIILEKGCLVNSLYHYPTNMTFFSSSEKLEIGGVPFVSILPKPKRAEALEYYRRIHKKFELNSHFFESVVKISKVKDTFQVQTSKNTYTAKNVILATGFYDNPLLLNVPGEELPKVFHYYNDPHFFSNQRVIVVGASNSSIDAALETYRKGAEVTLIIRGEEISPRVKYWVRPDIENRILEGAIKVYYQSQIRAIHPDHVLIDSPTGPLKIANDFVLALTGYKPNFEFLQAAGITIPHNSPRIPAHNPETMETNIPGLYLAGVVCGGLNTHLWFIENSRVHAEIIMQAIANADH